jgi:mannose-6-phosphate isomerase-like protein (cupin superfamily)
MNLFTLEAALKRQPEPGNFSVALAQLGQAELKFYVPKRVDLQTPHSRDEFYIIARGSGTLMIGTQAFSFSPGDVLFVEANVEHRFTEFSDDFATWVIFIG